jgi:DNA-binding NtrC family response regulator
LQFEQLGGTTTKSVDTRVILATNENLSKAVTEGTFRQDLYYRINVVNIVLPPLRERVGDIPLLVDHFLRDAVETCGREIDGFDQQAMVTLQSYGWPGNVRQLQNVVERAVLLSRGDQLTVDDLPPEILGKVADPIASSLQTESGRSATQPYAMTPASYHDKSLREALEGPEREIILHSLRRHNWNRAATADALEINRTTLYKKMKRLGLDDPRLQFALEA